MKIHISLWILLLALVVFFSAFALLIWWWVIPFGVLEYNLAVNLFTNSIFMVLTIVLLNMLFIVREESEWKAVKDYVKKSIQEELGALFIAMLDYVEGGFAIKFSLISLEDWKTANKVALSELRRLKEAKELKLLETELAAGLGRESELDTFSEISRNLYEIQIHYPRFFQSNIILSLMRIRDSIRMLKYTAQLQTEIQTMQKDPTNFPPLKSMKDEVSKATLAVIPMMASISFKSLMIEIDNIHKMGIEFSPRFSIGFSSSM